MLERYVEEKTEEGYFDGLTRGHFGKSRKVPDVGKPMVSSLNHSLDKAGDIKDPKGREGRIG